MNKLFKGYLLVAFCFLLAAQHSKSQNNDMAEVLETLKKGAEFFHSISTNGGYAWSYTVDLKKKWGEGLQGSAPDGQAAPTEIWVQDGTPAAGEVYLRAYKITGDNLYLDYAKDAADALIKGQKKPGGWDRRIDFNINNSEDDSPCMFDDNNTQGAISFLMRLDMLIGRKEIALQKCIDKALKFIIESQHENGGWPQWYPYRGGFHDYFTFNDGAINDCIRVMIEAHQNYGNIEYLSCLEKGGDFIILSQLPPPQSGWAQQYNHYLQPAWARVFEPPSVCPLVTTRNIRTLTDLYLYTELEKYLYPIPDAIRWIKESRLPNGRWPRFCELGTNKPIYYANRVRMSSYEAAGGRGGQSTAKLIGLEKLTENYNDVKNLGIEKYLEKINQPLSRNEILEKISNLEPVIKEIISSQDNKGRWITHDAELPEREPVRMAKLTGRIIYEDRIFTRVFLSNMNSLCEYLELVLPQ